MNKTGSRSFDGHSLKQRRSGFLVILLLMAQPTISPVQGYPYGRPPGKGTLHGGDIGDVRQPNLIGSDGRKILEQ